MQPSLLNQDRETLLLFVTVVAVVALPNHYRRDRKARCLSTHKRLVERWDRQPTLHRGRVRWCPPGSGPKDTKGDHTDIHQVERRREIGEKKPHCGTWWGSFCMWSFVCMKNEEDTGCIFRSVGGVFWYSTWNNKGTTWGKRNSKTIKMRHCYHPCVGLQSIAIWNEEQQTFK